jgi:hypothetical protein
MARIWVRVVTGSDSDDRIRRITDGRDSYPPVAAKKVFAGHRDGSVRTNFREGHSRTVRPREVATAVVYLASMRAAFSLETILSSTANISEQGAAGCQYREAELSSTVSI